MNKISSRQVGLLSFFLGRSLFLLFAFFYLLDQVKNDILIVIPLGTILGLVPLLIYYQIFRKDEDKNFFQKIEVNFSKPISLLYRIILFTCLLFLGCFLTFYIANYINYSLLPQIPLIIITLSFLLLVYYLGTKGIEALARTSEILFYIFILLVILSLLGLISYIDIEQVEPFFINDSGNILKSSITYAFFITIPYFLLLGIPRKNIEDKRKIPKTIFKSYLLTSLVIEITFFITISILGIDLSLFYQYPMTLLLKKVTFLNIIERLESVLSIHYLFDLFLLLSTLFLNLKEGIQSIFYLSEKKKVHRALFLVTIFILFGSSYIPHNISYYIIMSIICCFVLPLFLFFKQLIRK